METLGTQQADVLEECIWSQFTEESRLLQLFQISPIFERLPINKSNNVASKAQHQRRSCLSQAVQLLERSFKAWGMVIIIRC